MARLDYTKIKCLVIFMIVTLQAPGTVVVCVDEGEAAHLHRPRQRSSQVNLLKSNNGVKTIGYQSSWFPQTISGFYTQNLLSLRQTSCIFRVPSWSGTYCAMEKMATAVHSTWHSTANAVHGERERLHICEQHIFSKCVQTPKATTTSRSTMYMTVYLAPGTLRFLCLFVETMLMQCKHAQDDLLTPLIACAQLHDPLASASHDCSRPAQYGRVRR